MASSLEADVTVRGTVLDAAGRGLVAFEVTQGERLVQAFVADPAEPVHVTLPRRLDRIYSTGKVR